MPGEQTSSKKIDTSIRLFLIIIILIGAASLAAYWLSHPPRADRKSSQSVALLVETTRLHSADHPVVVKVMGTVIPSQRIDLAAQVRGEIISIQPDLLPGGRFQQGEPILLIDPADYELTVRQRHSDVAQAEYELKSEEGKQTVAKSEYALLGEEINPENKELILRKPQMKAAGAALDAAKASLQQAELDLKRTRVVAPFNSLVEDKYIGLGSQVTVGTKLVTLIDTKRYWIEVSIPADKLTWINIPGINSSQGSPARLTKFPGWHEDSYRTGTVKSLLAAVDSESRMAALLVEIQDPLCLQPANRGKPPLTVNSFIHMEIKGKTLKKAFRIPRFALHEGEKVWIMSARNTLDIRPVNVAWDEDDTVYISNNLSDGENLVVSSIAAPVQGMSLRTLSKETKERN